MTIGIVGLGNIGLPAALNLVGAGHEVIGYARRPVPAFVSGGGRQAASLADVALCPVIVHCLPGVAALSETLDGLVPAIAPGTVVLDLSSYPLLEKQRAAARIAEVGGTMLDGEISGLPFQVAQRSAVIFVAGDAEVAARVSPVLDGLGGRHHYLGAFGAATRLKLIANYMVAAHNLIAAEAMAMAGAVGLDPAQAIEVLKGSAAGSTTFANKAPTMVSRDFQNGKGPFSHMFGYLERARAMAAENGLAGAVPILTRTEEVYAIARDQERHLQDIAAIVDVLEFMKDDT